VATNHAVINASRHDVFAVLRDGWTYSNWVVGTSHMRAVETTWPQVGSRLFHSSGIWPAAIHDSTTIEAMEPDRKLILLAKGRPFGSARITIELDDDGPNCAVTMHETPVSGLGKLAHNPVGEAVLFRRNAEALGRLAAIAERHTAPQA
jgi:hypothetical protein